jgi:hypothetical protein
MGNCTNTKSQSAKRRAYEECPPDIASFSATESRRREFAAQLGNVKIESISKAEESEQLGVRFEVPEVMAFECAPGPVRDSKIKVPHS